MFSIEARFDVDMARLDDSFHQMMRKVHPDRHSAGTDAERRRAVQWASAINQAYTEIAQPLARAKALCALAGEAIDPSRHSLGADFLARVLDWREQLEVLRASVAEDRGASAGVDHAAPAGLYALRDEVLGERNALVQAFAASAVARDPRHASPEQARSAAHLVSQWMFAERFIEELRQHRAALEEASQAQAFAGLASGVQVSSP